MENIKDFINIKFQKENKLNTYVYVDYENITKQLKNYETTPIKIKFFETIKEYLEKFNLNIIDFLVYANFDDGQFTKGKCQTELQGLGLQTRHTSNKGKNSGDLEMTIDALSTLYKNKFADVFVIISCDRDFIPLIKAIKSENKISYVISTKIGFNEVVATYADEHEYIENIFNNQLKIIKEEKEDILIETDISFENNDLVNIKKVCNLFYKSDLYKNNVEEIRYNNFSNNVAKALSMKTAIVKSLFKKADEFGFIKIYEGNKKILCLKDGENKKEIIV